MYLHSGRVHSFGRGDYWRESQLRAARQMGAIKALVMKGGPGWPTVT